MKPKGFLLIASYLLMSVLSIFSLALFSRGNTFFQASERNENKIIAFNMAEAGVDQAIVQLKSDPTYSGAAYSAMPGAPKGGYQVTVTVPATNPNGIPNANPNIRQIVAQGFSPSNDATQKAYETRTVMTYVSLAPSSLFDFAVFAKDSIKLNGNPGDIVDSFNSTNGAYDPATAGLKGHIGTNSIGNGDVALIGNVTVKGDATIGPGGTPGDVISLGPNTTITGNQTAATAPYSFEAPEATGTNLGDVSISGQTTYTLASGTYTMSSLKIGGQAQLAPTGPVKIYVTGEVDLGGQGVATSGNLPANFQLYVTTDASVKLAGGSALYGAIYAPLSDVKNTGGATVFGAIVADEYDQSGGGSLHFDEALKEIEGSSGNEVTMDSWTESNTSLGS